MKKNQNLLSKIDPLKKIIANLTIDYNSEKKSNFPTKIKYRTICSK